MTPATAELEALYRARTDSALARYTQADVDFVTLMIAHHAQALAMASLVPSRTSDDEIRTLAARVTTGQTAEIDLMRQWLEERELSAPAPGATHHASGAPGMLSPEQLSRLESTRGRAFDRLFLELMIQHHTGAVTMVDRLFATPGAALEVSVFRLASGIQVDQRTEIARMQAMLESLPAPRPAR